MFKQRLKDLAKSQDSTVGFEILNDQQTAFIMGGCDALNRCRRFSGSCATLKKCGVFADKIDG